METPIIFAVEIEKPTSVARDITAAWVAYLGGVKAFHNLCHLRFDSALQTLAKSSSKSMVGSPLYGLPLLVSSSIINSKER